MLADALESLAYEAAFWMQAVEDSDYPIDELGAVSRLVGDNFRACAIILLSARASVDGFLHNLIRASNAQRRYLERAKSEAPDDHFFTAGRYSGVADALAANNLELARSAIELSPDEFRERREYLDDFLFARSLSGLVMAAITDGELRGMADRFDSYVLVPDVRMETLCAIHSRSSENFEEVFGILLQQRDATIRADIERGQIETPVVCANRQVYVEGIALLNLANRYGIQTQREYRQCPSLARQAMRTPFPGS